MTWQFGELFVNLAPSALWKVTAERFSWKAAAETSVMKSGMISRLDFGCLIDVHLSIFEKVTKICHFL